MSEAKSGDTVRIHYTGRLPDGTQFDSSADGDPLEFELGAGHIIPGLDRQISGMSVGDTSTVNVPCAEAYGPHNAEAVRTVPRASLPAEIELAQGMQLQATTAEGEQVPLVVVEFDEQNVTLDANHPLAGRDLEFEVELIEIV